MWRACEPIRQQASTQMPRYLWKVGGDSGYTDPCVRRFRWSAIQGNAPVRLWITSIQSRIYLWGIILISCCYSGEKQWVRPNAGVDTIMSFSRPQIHWIYIFQCWKFEVISRIIKSFNFTWTVKRQYCSFLLSRFTPPFYFLAWEMFPKRFDRST
jgi:hypothetical protein